MAESRRLLRSSGSNNDFADEKDDSDFVDFGEFVLVLTSQKIFLDLLVERWNQLLRQVDEPFVDHNSNALSLALLGFNVLPYHFTGLQKLQ